MLSQYVFLRYKKPDGHTARVWARRTRNPNAFFRVNREGEEKSYYRGDTAILERELIIINPRDAKILPAAMNKKYAELEVIKEAQ